MVLDWFDRSKKESTSLRERLIKRTDIDEVAISTSARLSMT